MGWFKLSEYSYRSPIKSRFSPKERKVILFLGDVLVSALSLLIALVSWAKGDDWLGLSPQSFAERPENWFYFLPALWLILMVPLYNLKRAASHQETLRSIGIAILVCLGTYLCIFFLAPPKALPRRGAAVFFISVALLSIVWRFLYIRLFTVRDSMMNVIIVGAGKSGTTISEIILKISPRPFNLVGFIDDDPQKKGAMINGIPVLGDSSVFFSEIEKNQVGKVILSISHKINPQLFEALTLAEERGLMVDTMPQEYEDLLGRVPVFLLDTDWMLRSFYDQAHASVFFEMVKRAFDIIGSVIGMVFLIVLFPFVAAVILIDSGFPIFYTQERLGVRSTPFRIIKFRTMYQNAEKDGVARPASDHDKRITRTGHFLRKSHIDEMPQFINVLRGDLSLVGPRAERPEIVEQLQKEIPFYRGRLLVRPGITGWAQVNYGYASGAEENAVKLEYDLYYIKHRNVFMDVAILIKTVRSVIGLEGR